MQPSGKKAYSTPKLTDHGTVQEIMRLQRQTEVTEQGEHEGHHQAQADLQPTVVGEGKVVAVVPGNSQVVVEHGEIKDFMGPMTMGYPTAPASLLEGLSVGDKIRFTIDVQKKTIVKIEKLSK